MAITYHLVFECDNCRVKKTLEGRGEKEAPVLPEGWDRKGEGRNIRTLCPKCSAKTNAETRHYDIGEATRPWPVNKDSVVDDPSNGYSIVDHEAKTRKSSQAIVEKAKEALAAREKQDEMAENLKTVAGKQMPLVSTAPAELREIEDAAICIMCGKKEAIIVGQIKALCAACLTKATGLVFENGHFINNTGKDFDLSKFLSGPDFENRLIISIENFDDPDTGGFDA